MADPLEDLARLRDEADVLAQKVQAAQAAAAATEYTGTDTTGAVTIVLDPAGAVRSVEVAQDWRRKVDPDVLSAAVQEAFQAASIARLGVFTDALDEVNASPDPAPRTAAPVGDSLAVQLDEASTRSMSSDEGRRALTELAGLLNMVNEGIDQITAQMETFVHATYAGRSRSGHVTATVTSVGEIAEIRYDKRWLVKAHEYNIGRETADALRVAHQKAGEHTIADIVAASPLGEVQALSQDPLALARRLHLRND